MKNFLVGAAALVAMLTLALAVVPGRNPAWYGGNTASTATDYDFLMDAECCNSGDIETRPRLTNQTPVGITLGTYQIFTNGVDTVGSNNLITISSFAKRGTRSMRYGVENDWGWCRFDLGTDDNACSMSFWFYLSAAWTGSTFASYDWGGLRGSGGEFAVLNMYDGAGATGIEVQMHTTVGTGSPIAVSNSFWYLAAFQWDAPGTNATLNIYNSALAFVGSSACLLNNENASYVDFGRTDNHGVHHPTAFVYFDDVVYDAGNVFPLYPP